MVRHLDASCVDWIDIIPLLATRPLTLHLSAPGLRTRALPLRLVLLVVHLTRYCDLLRRLDTL